MPSFGLAASSVSINASVEIITFGTLAGLNTSGFSVGDILFISTNGTSGNTLTATAPSGESSLIQNIGIVQRSHASAGSIKVGGAGRTNATPNLDDGDIFIGNGSNQAVTASLNTKIEDYLDGGTSTANFDTISVDGTEITATPAELNVLDGITSTTAELNYTDGVTSNIQTQLDAKAPLASPAFTGTATGANLTLSGDLTVNGSTTTLDTTNLAVEDNLMELNAGVTSNANDSGFLIERGSTGDNAIFMWDESADKFTLGTTTATGTTTGDITLSSTGTLVASLEGNVTGDVTGNADTATTLATARNFSLTGDVTAGAVSFDGSGNVALSTTIAANSVALGTDTTGNYMSDLTEGTGIDITHTPAEGSNATIALDLTEVGFGGGANRLITDDGDGTVTAESGLTYGGSALTLTGDLNISGYIYDSVNSGNRLDLDDDSDQQGSQVALYGINHLNLVADNTNNGTGEIRFWKGAVSDLDSGTNTRLMTIDNSGNVTFNAGDVKLGATKRLYLDGGGDTFWYEAAANVPILVTGGTERFRVNNVGNVQFNTTQADANFRISTTSDVNTFFVDAGTDRVGIGTNSPSVKLDVAGGDIAIDATQKLYLDGGSQTYITESQNDVMDFYAGSVLMLRMEESGTDYVQVFDNTKLSVGTGKDLQIYHNETNSFGADNYTGHLIFQQRADDQDIIFKNDDGAGGVTDYLTLDGSTTDLLLSPPGNVGIGTTSPTAKLDVRGNVSFFSSDASDFVSFTHSDNGIIINSAGSTSNKMFLRTGGSDALTIDASQNVGIGTTSPSALLDVGGDADEFALIGRARVGYNSHSDYASFQHRDSATSGGYALLQQTTGATYLNAASGQPIYFRINNSDKMQLASNGNMIVGSDYTTNAATKLVVSHTGANGILLNNDAGNTANSGRLFFEGTSTSAIFQEGNDLSFRTGASTGSSSGTERMLINSSGNVGIGSSSPSFKLKVNVDNGTYTDWETIAAFQTKRSADSETEAGIMINSLGDALGGQISSNYYWSDNVAARGNTGRSGAIFGMSNNAGAAGTHSSFYWQTSPNNSNTLTDRMQLDTNGNLKLFDNTANPSASSNNAFIFCDSGEMKVLDELGNTTTISPHNFSLIPGGASEDRAWGYYSEKDIVDDDGNVTATQKVNVDMMKLARLVEELTGEKLVYTEED